MSSRLRPGDGAVFITGASTGIGADTALGLASDGFLVFTGVRKPADGERLVAQAAAGKGKGNLVPVIVDVSDAAQVDAAAATVKAHLASLPAGGPHKPHLVAAISNAGIVSGPGPAEALDPSVYASDFDVNFYGAVRVNRAFLPLLRESPKGARIVHISTIGVAITPPYLSPYAASKAALEAYAGSLRRELVLSGQGRITVTNIRPGSIATPIWGKNEREDAKILAGLDASRMDAYFGARFPDVVRGMVDDQVKVAAPPRVVTDRIREVLAAGSPPQELPAGTDSNAVHWIKAVVPRAWFDWIVNVQLRKAHPKLLK
ncbi:hypothetical protein DFJ74DRAFT_754449 [Hyaloraphidium curvatum]|nr:hypothetical protein DFJ74DRAFT_754449 [Hyaloraphidium curvatum]